MCNRSRAVRRPIHPTDLDFQLLQEHLPEDFIIWDLNWTDVTVGNARHLVFSTPKQRQLLEQSKNWYVDGTFKIV